MKLGLFILEGHRNNNDGRLAALYPKKLTIQGSEKINYKRIRKNLVKSIRRDAIETI
jgi:hypothetical protein